MKKYDCVVIGSGHAGIEAAYAAAKLRCSVLLLTIDVDAIGKLSCNPSVGGVSKGHLVREVDACGGLIGRLADQSALGYRILNRSKGKAVWASRVQVDKYRYPRYARTILENHENIEILQAKARRIHVKNGSVYGVETNYGELFRAKSLIVCAGTFLNSVIHIGLNSFPGGRLYEEASVSLLKSIRALGLKIRYFKTGTCARLDSRTLDYSRMQEQKPEQDVIPFSAACSTLNKRSLSCFITHTNKKTHALIRKSLGQSPLYTGKIRSTGVRYCPSLEDKIVKFPDRDQHHVFIEPEALDSYEVYPNGLSTSLPFDVQVEFIRSISGLEKARIIRPGYGIEHGVIDARQLFPTLEYKKVNNLYFAGQVNGTTGYEEAAAQGFIAGVNAALKIQRKQPFILERNQAVMGVLVDDLTSKGTNEPYRMFTSRCEFRLSLRETNCDLRLSGLAYELGLLDRKGFDRMLSKKRQIDRVAKKMRTIRVAVGSGKAFLGDLLKQPEHTYESLEEFIRPAVRNKSVRREIEALFKYEGFLKRENSWLREMDNLDKIKIPDIDFAQVPSLSREAVEKLNLIKPRTLGKALKISGITPAAVKNIYIYIRKSSGK